MCMDDDQYERVCRDEFAAINTKLDRLDEALRGNGRPGITVRLDRLEQDAKRQAKMIWLILGAVVPLAVATIWQQVFGG